MENWLESEENKRDEEDKRIKNLRKVLYEKEALLNESLNVFFKFCDRVNTLHWNSLKVLNNSAEGKFYTVFYRKEGWSDDDFKAARGVKFNYIDADNYTVDLFIYEFSSRLLGGYDSTRTESNTKRILFCKKIDLQDINQWGEEQILELIKWLINDKGFEQVNPQVISAELIWTKHWQSHNYPKESLPGKKDAIIFDIESQFTILNNRLRLEQKTYAEIGKWSFGRPERIKNEQLKTQGLKIQEIYEFLNQIGAEGMMTRFLKYNQK